MARPERFERPTPWFVAKYSIQLSYGRAAKRADSNLKFSHMQPFDSVLGRSALGFQSFFCFLARGCAAS